ncbi:hypothetical protein D1631_05500 [Chryseobacterium nematophagum]|uniref:T9SS C-terminal target domain-containing protein n=1 Tax=Chryseobacterium nematophagum TaxID=2305228 RepID=A0A3M7TD55_9FLAO|nr:hypothetical protein [Chryseobacterium nematophagum]RNA61425.1 hypothetical protein D1631_05500 [Chryseobacterium nematophagum]
MKKKLFLMAGGLMFSAVVHGQVGVNTQTPKSTLDVVGTLGANTADGVLVPRYTVTELAAKDAAYGSDQNGVLVFISSGTGVSGKTSNITGSGFYYYDNSISKWFGVGGSSTSSFVKTAEIVDDNYTVKPTDDFIQVTMTVPDKTLTLPTSGISPGKIIYVSNIGGIAMKIQPPTRNQGRTVIEEKNTMGYIYLGGTGAGSWDRITGY